MICPACKTEIEKEIEICTNCEFPFNGTEKQRGIHIGRFINQKGIVNDSDNSIIKSQKILIGIATINLVILLLQFSKGKLEIADIIFNGVLTLIILLCGIFIKKKPITFTFIPLILIIAINILNYILDPKSLLNGVFFKIFIIGSLVYSIYLVRESEKFKKKFK